MINPLITTDPEDAEWRSIRAINKFTDVIREEGKEPIYRSTFDPKCVRSILVRPDSPIEMKLRIFVSVDSRYRHVVVTSKLKGPARWCWRSRSARV